ncbi:MAG TPA: 4'-phosphopantetheinyl transferase superfamily protein [Candidatus Paceibacterota bacterium]|nr:4'-phosphopantetheinyl transferase superfamily protein [Candidatus Paceibacterota bacterium]
MGNLVGIGTDIAHIERFRTLSHPERVASLYLLPGEWAQAQAAVDLSTFLASRFAAKEAVIKACPEPLSPLDFSIEKSGVKPIVSPVRPLPYSFLISISHESAYATATACCTERS